MRRHLDDEAEGRGWCVVKRSKRPLRYSRTDTYTLSVAWSMRRRPDGTWGIKGVRRVLYRLDEIQISQEVYVVEGEKDADTLAALGLKATTNPMGAGKWQEEYADQLVEAGVLRVNIIPDCAPEGREHAAAGRWKSPRPSRTRVVSRHS